MWFRSLLPQMLNLLPAGSTSAVVNVLHTKQDALALGRIVGASRGKKMTRDRKETFMLHYNAAD